jgi:hypothetical protein
LKSLEIYFIYFFSGLILQDLTFINIGNQDFLPDGNINFAKRWQQFHILDSMRRFKKWFVLSTLKHNLLFMKRMFFRTAMANNIRKMNN